MVQKKKAPSSCGLRILRVWVQIVVRRFVNWVEFIIFFNGRPLTAAPCHGDSGFVTKIGLTCTIRVAFEDEGISTSVRTNVALQLDACTSMMSILDKVLFGV